MRVATSSFPSALERTVSDLTVQLDRLQNQASTGQRIRNPEDDPAAVRNVLDLQSNFQLGGQYANNIGKLQGTITSQFTALKGLKGLSDRASEIATLATGINSPEALGAYASELDQMLESVLGLANSQAGGAYLFAGTQDSTPPFAATRDARGAITAVDYAGNANVARFEIAKSVTTTVGIPGANTGTSGAAGLLRDARSGVDVFAHLVELRDALRSGDTTSISRSVLPKLRLDETGYSNQMASLGASQARLDTRSSQIASESAQTGEQISARVDADLANTLVQLNQLQAAYSAALQSGARILGHSLLDYL